MSVFGLGIGIPTTKKTILTDTSATTVLDATDKSGLHVVGIVLCNDTGAPLTPIVDVYDGTNTFVLRDNASLADETSESVTLPGFLTLAKGEVLRVTSAANLNIFVSYMNISTQRGA